MKLNARDAARFFASPDTRAAGVLIHGPDASRIALRRKDLVAALVGPEGEAEMRFTRIGAADLRKDPAMLSDALKAQGFFPGQRAVLVEDAGDGVAKPLAAALEDWAEGDAFLIVTAGQLTPRSALRKLFEGSKTAYAVAVYADPPGRDEIEAALKAGGLTQVSPDAMRDLVALAQALDPGDFRQTVESLSLYKHGDETAVTPEDVAAVAPLLSDAALDDVIASVADGQLDRLAGMLPRLTGQGAQPTAICIALQRHFRQLHAAAVHPQGPDQGLARARPPVFGPRRDRMLRQARHWGPRKLESILGQILEADLALRSTRAVPARALIERLMIRIAMAHSR